MIAAESHRSGSHKGAQIQGWIISVLVHSTVAITAILFVKQVQLTPTIEAFKWNVAMVSPAPQGHPPIQDQTQAPVRSGPSPTSAPIPSAQQPTQTQPVSSSQLLDRQTPLPISERTNSLTMPESAPPTLTELTTPAKSTTHTIEQAEPIRHATALPIVPEPMSIVKSVDAPMGISPESDTQNTPSNALTSILEQAAQADQVPAQMAAISQIPSTAPSKRDYGWLSEAVLRRMEELKRYPASARVDRAEGKVVVKAVITEDGNLGEVEVFQSSGHPALDKAAIDTMRQAAPFYLPHPLGQPRMTIKIPMSYRLDR